MRKIAPGRFDMYILSEEGPSIGLWEALDNWQCYRDSGMSPSEETGDEMRFSTGGERDD